MADPADIGLEENWVGGFYELMIELGPTGDARLQGAMTSVWAAAEVEGCFGAGDEPGTHEAVPCSVEALRDHGHLRGTVRLPTGARVVCGLFVTRLDEDGIDWLALYLPLGALEMTDRRIGGFPFGDDGGTESVAWRQPIDRWLAAVGRAVHHEVGIRRALIGFEVDLPEDDVIPHERWDAILVPDGDDLRFIPANR